MAYNPPAKNAAFVCYITLSDSFDSRSFVEDPTIASGDFKVSKDGGALTNLTNLPVVEPSGSVMVKLDLTSTEMDADNVTIVGIDQTDPKEWTDFVLNIVTVN